MFSWKQLVINIYILSALPLNSLGFQSWAELFPWDPAVHNSPTLFSPPPSKTKAHGFKSPFSHPGSQWDGAGFQNKHLACLGMVALALSLSKTLFGSWTGMVVLPNETFFYWDASCADEMVTVVFCKAGSFGVLASLRSFPAEDSKGKQTWGKIFAEQVWKPWWLRWKREAIGVELCLSH